MLLPRMTATLLRRRATPAALATFPTRWMHQHTTPPPPPRQDPSPSTMATAAAATATALGLGAVGLTSYLSTDPTDPTDPIAPTHHTSLFFPTTMAACASNNTGPDPTQTFYSRQEVAEHTTAEKGIWVTFENGVYDITRFVEEHPGGSKRIMMAAGGRIDPFWKLYQQHFTDKVSDILKDLRIGTLHPDEEIIVDESDPYAMEPERHPALLVRKAKPFNAETPKALMHESYLTPNALWYVRHHHPVPVVDPATFQMAIKNQTHLAGNGEMTFENVSSLSLQDIKTKYKKYEVVATMQCGGNRRDALNASGKTQGLCWDVGAISTAKWGGARLRDVLADVAGIRTLEDAEKMNVKHVHFLPLGTVLVVVVFCGFCSSVLGV
jgi:sulfite oxidase